MTGKESATNGKVFRHYVDGRWVHWKPESGMHPILRRWVRDAGDGNGEAMGKLGKCFADGLLGVEEENVETLYVVLRQDVVAEVDLNVFFFEVFAVDRTPEGNRNKILNANLTHLVPPNGVGGF